MTKTSPGVAGRDFVAIRLRNVLLIFYSGASVAYVGGKAGKADENFKISTVRNQFLPPP